MAKTINVNRAGRSGTFEKITTRSTFSQIFVAFGLMHAVHAAMLVGYITAVSHIGLIVPILLILYAAAISGIRVRGLLNRSLVDLIFQQRDANDWHRILNSLTALVIATTTIGLIMIGYWPSRVEFSGGYVSFYARRAPPPIPSVKFALLTAVLVAWLSRRTWRDTLWALRSELLLPQQREHLRTGNIDPAGIPAPDDYELRESRHARRTLDDAGFSVPDPGSSEPDFGAMI